jgi:hypothetical protein
MFGSLELFDLQLRDLVAPAGAVIQGRIGHCAVTQSHGVISPLCAVRMLTSVARVRRTSAVAASVSINAGQLTHDSLLGAGRLQHDSLHTGEMLARSITMAALTRLHFIEMGLTFFTA